MKIKRIKLLTYRREKLSIYKRFSDPNIKGESKLYSNKSNRIAVSASIIAGNLMNIISISVYAKHLL